MSESPWETHVERLSVTLKGGKGYESPWIVFKGSTVEEVNAELEKLQADPKLLQATAIVSAAFQGYVLAGNGAPAPQAQAPQYRATEAQSTYTTPQQPQAPAVQPAAPQAPAGGGGFCDDCGGARAFKSGKNAKGVWQGWFCPTPNSGHKVKWVQG